MSYKKHFSNSAGLQNGRLHFAAHSHHPWPDVTLNAQLEYWQDASTLLDQKWERIFSVIIPELQQSIAATLSLPNPASISFAANTHEFLIRVLSCLPTGSVPRILTTDSEFHSFTRQIARLEEDGLISVVRVAVQPFESFIQRFLDELKRMPGWDLVWLSHVFFNSGYSLSIKELTAIQTHIVSEETLLVIDGYHAFIAMPLNLAPLAERSFYLAGGYKYAMAGEGVCFMHCPRGIAERPRATGWFAEFGELENRRASGVQYAKHGGRFLGATMDPSGCYRMRAVFNWMKQIQLSVENATDYCSQLQEFFLARLSMKKNALRPLKLVVENSKRRGRFLTFEGEKAAELSQRLAVENVIVDHRGSRLRIGFGIYQDQEDVERLLHHLAIFD